MKILKMTDRLSYLESDFDKARKKPGKSDPDDAKIIYTNLARYDFAGTGPRHGVIVDSHLYRQAASFKTRGEVISPLVLRFATILLRTAVGVIFMYLMLHGREFNCLGIIYDFT